MLDVDKMEFLASSESKADVDPIDFETCNRKTRIKTMRTAVDDIIERTERHAKARGYVLQGAEIFDKIKETISSALTSYPPAALAFSGLCATLPVSSVLKITEEV